MNDEFNKNIENENENSSLSENTENSSSASGKEVTEEYEVSFDSISGDYSYKGGDLYSFSETPHTAKSPQSDINQNNREKSEKKKKSPIIYITAMVVAFAIICASLAAGAFALDTILGKLNLSNGIIDNSPVGSIKGTKLTVSKSDIELAPNAVSKATYAAYDSNLLIEAYADSNASTLAGTGSGVLWTADGYVVTCNHVVDGCSAIKVTFTDGTSYFVEEMATDPITDLAVLKIEIAEGSEVLPVTARDTSKNPLMLGETVIAIGNPLGYLTSTVTDGILSSLEREITVEGTDMVLMQISAAVNSGNSGGGLYDINGSLIGIVNAKVVSDGVEGIGFAIPIHTVDSVITQLAENGYVSGRPQVGVNLVTITNYNYNEVFSSYPDLKKYATTSSGKWGMSSIITGTYLVSISEDIRYSDSSESQLKFGDRIYQIANDDGDFISVENAQVLQNFIASQEVGDTVHITVMREGKAKTISVILTEKKGA